jgi:acyl carrier protein
MVGLRKRLKLMSRNKPQELAKNRAMVTQGLVLRGESMVCRNSIVSPTREPSRVYFNPCGTAVSLTPFLMTHFLLCGLAWPQPNAIREAEVASDTVTQVVLEVLEKLVPGYSKRHNPKDDLVIDLRIDSDDLSFYFIPEVQRRLRVDLPPEEWSNVATIEEICELLNKYIGARRP